MGPGIKSHLEANTRWIKEHPEEWKKMKKANYEKYKLSGAYKNQLERAKYIRKIAKEYIDNNKT